MTNNDQKTSTGANLEHGWAGGYGDSRLDTPTVHRNHDAILRVLQQHLASETTGSALEIGSGSGQHIVRFAEKFPHLNWIPSDPDPRYRASVEAWTSVSSAKNVSAPVDLDVELQPWGLVLLEDLQAIVCINVLHITPWSVTEGLLAGAGSCLARGASMFIYGPFMRDGQHTAESNAAFDHSLRTRNKAWGIRDIAAIEGCAKTNNLALMDVETMPANNFTLIFRRNA